MRKSHVAYSNLKILQLTRVDTRNALTGLVLLYSYGDTAARGQTAHQL